MGWLTWIRDRSKEFLVVLHDTCSNPPQTLLALRRPRRECDGALKLIAEHGAPFRYQPILSHHLAGHMLLLGMKGDADGVRTADSESTTTLRGSAGRGSSAPDSTPLLRTG